MTTNNNALTANLANTAVTAKFEVFNPQSDIYQTRESGLSEPLAPHHLITVSTPKGGGTRWEIEGDGVEPEVVPAIEGILVATVRRGVIWPSEEFTGAAQKPAIVTNDMVIGHVVGDLGDLDPAAVAAASNADGTVRWQDLPYTQWQDGEKPRAIEYRDLFILRPGEILPVRVVVRGASLASLAPVIRRFTAPPFRHVVNLSLEKRQTKSGIVYSSAVLRVVEKLTPEQGEVVRRLYSAPIMDSIAASTPKLAAPSGAGVVDGQVTPF